MHGARYKYEDFSTENEENEALNMLHVRTGYRVDLSLFNTPRACVIFSVPMFRVRRRETPGCNDRSL